MKILQKLGVGLVCLTLISTFGCTTPKKVSASASNSPKLNSSTSTKTKAATTATATAAATATPVATIAGTAKPVGIIDGGFASQDPLVLSLFTMDTDTDITATKTPIALTTDMTFGGQFFATTSINYVETFCPSYNDALGALTLSIYNWKTDYATTVAGTVLQTKDFIDYKDNEWLQLAFATPLPAGEYLWVLSNPVDPGVGIWDVVEGPVDHATDVINYVSGEPTDTFHMCRVQYSKTPNITLIQPSK